MTEEELKAMLAAAANGAASYAPQSGPMVWLGGQPRDGFTIRRGGYRVKPEYGTVSAEQAVAEFLGWDDDKLLEWQKLLKQNGIEVSSYEDLSNQWATAVNIAAQSLAYYQAGYIDRPLTPEQAIKQIGENNKKLFGDGSGATTTTNTSTSNLSASDVRAMGDSAWQSELGRAPTAAELGSLASSSTSTTTSTTRPNGNSSSSTQQGANLGQLAVENARSQGDWAEHQAATTYMNAFLGAIGSVV